MSSVGKTVVSSREVKSMKQVKHEIKRLQQILKGDCVVLTVDGDTLIVDAGNKSAKEVKELANVFFKHAYQIPTN